MQDRAVAYMFAGILARLANRNKDLSIEEEMRNISIEIIEGISLFDKGKVKQVTHAKFLEGKFIGDKK